MINSGRTQAVNPAVAGGRCLLSLQWWQTDSQPGGGWGQLPPQPTVVTHRQSTRRWLRAVDSSANSGRTQAVNPAVAGGRCLLNQQWSQTGIIFRFKIFSQVIEERREQVPFSMARGNEARGNVARGGISHPMGWEMY